jgi:Zinc finger, C3HC4 type (RING finger)
MNYIRLYFTLSNKAAVQQPDPDVDGFNKLIYDYSGQCPVCFDDCTNPRIMPCCHAICTDCVDKLCKNNKSRRRFPCPNCRRDTRVPRGGSAGFDDLEKLRENYIMDKYAQHRSRHIRPTDFNVSQVRLVAIRFTKLLNFACNEI